MVNETITPGNDGLANIFRQQAISALNTIDENDVELKIINSSSWLWLLVCLLLLTGVIIWLVFGQITFTVESPGIVVDTKQIDVAEASVMREIKEKKDKSDELDDLYNKKMTLYKKHYLTRVDILRARDEYVAANSDFIESKNKLIVSMHQNKSESPTLALVFVNYLQGKKIIMGMRGYAMETNSRNRFSGNVVGVTEYPVTKQLIYYYLQNTALVDTLFNGGAPYLIKFQLNDHSISAGTPVITNVTYKSCSPLQLLIKSANCD